MKKWKLLRDYEMPGGRVVAGTLLIPYAPGVVWLFSINFRPTDYPDWFEQVDVCDECEKEVCDYDHASEIAGRGCVLCHGHAVTCEEKLVEAVRLLRTLDHWCPKDTGPCRVCDFVEENAE